MVITDRPSDSQKEKPYFINIGSDIKNTNDGITSHNTEYDIAAIWLRFLFSTYIQINERIDTNGNDISKEAIRLERFETSLTIKIIRADTVILIIENNI